MLGSRIHGVGQFSFDALYYGVPSSWSEKEAKKNTEVAHFNQRVKDVGHFEEIP
jgi:hypothetical protein